MKVLLKLVLVFIILTSCKEPREILTSEVYKIKNGYGYKIILKDKVIIKQNCIPAIQGNIPFCDSLDALKVSQIVIKKIKSKKMPSIQAEDLMKLKIKIKC